MEHTEHHFGKHTKTSKPSDLMKIIAVIVFVLVVAGLVFYFRTYKAMSPTSGTAPMTQTEEESITGDVGNIGTPDTIDLGMVEDDLNQTEKGLKTIDNFENL